MFGVGSTYQWMGSRAMNVELCSLDGGREGLAHQRERVSNSKIGRDVGAARTHTPSTGMSAVRISGQLEAHG